MSKALIPKLTDLINDDESFYKNDQFKILLNQNPINDWVKTNPYANNSKYLPIDKHEMLLDRLFKRWRIEVLKTSTLFNAIEVTVRVHYFNPVINDWEFQDGVGAKELQTVKDSGTLKPDFSNVGSNAVSMALPIAKSEAIKDATHHIGKIFGRDLNRKDIVDFQPTYREYVDNKTLAGLIESAVCLEDVQKIITDNPRISLNAELMKLIATKKESFL